MPARTNFHHVDTLEIAAKYIAFLMDNTLPGKTYENFQLVDSSKTRVIRQYDMQQLLLEKRLRQQQKRETGRDKDRGRGIV